MNSPRSTGTCAQVTASHDWRSPLLAERSAGSEPTELTGFLAEFHSRLPALRGQDRPLLAPRGRAPQRLDRRLSAAQTSPLTGDHLL